MSAPPSDDDVTGFFDPTMSYPPGQGGMPAAPQPAHDGGNALPAGMRLAEFELLSVVGEGGFGIVYRAWDHSLKRQVAVKEYMPSSLAQRVGGMQVSVRSEKYKETFDAGKDSFVKEARMLAQFDHPALVKVFRFWEANGSAYMVMPFYEGITLRDELRQRGTPPDEATLLGWLGPVADALAIIHAEYWYHRDIAPDNVLLLAGSRRPVLLDFGAARRVIGDMTQALTVILKPGYAPVEQYAEIPGMKQGPVDRRLRAGGAGLLRGARPHAAAVGGPAGERQLRAAVQGGRGPLQRAFAARGRPRAGGAAREPHTVHRRFQGRAGPGGIAHRCRRRFPGQPAHGRGRHAGPGPAGAPARRSRRPTTAPRWWHRHRNARAWSPGQKHSRRRPMCARRWRRARRRRLRAAAAPAASAAPAEGSRRGLLVAGAAVLAVGGAGAWWFAGRGAAPAPAVAEAPAPAASAPPHPHLPRSRPVLCRPRSSSVWSLRRPRAGAWSSPLPTRGCAWTATSSC